MTVSAPDAPAAVGPYSHAVRAGDLLFCSGQIALDPVSGALVGTTPSDQARQCLTNLAAVAVAGGTRLENAVQVIVYLADIEAFAEVNVAYESVFAADAPARVAVGVAALPMGAQVEISAIFAIPAAA